MHSRFAICVVLIASCAFLTIAKPASAKIVYTPVNTTLTGGGHIKIDLNHDGIKDFDIQAAASTVACGLGHGVHEVVTVTPTTRDGVVASGTNAVALDSGIKVGPTGMFSNYQSLMTNLFFSRGCGPSYRNGDWCRVGPIYSCLGSGYLGLEVLVNGQTHYGWAYVTVTGSLLNGLSVTLKGFAYETIAGRGITTGQTSGV